MIEYKDLANDFWKEAETKKDLNKSWQKIYNWLDRDNLGKIDICDDNKIFFIELNPGGTLPNYAFNFIKKWCKKKGYEYLYDKYPVEAIK